MTPKPASMRERACGVCPNWRVIVDLVLCVSGIVVAIVTWPDIKDCAVLYKLFLCVGALVCIIDSLCGDIKIEHDEHNSRNNYLCLTMALLLIAIMPTLIIDLPSSCAAPLPARLWMFAWQAAAAAYAGHFLRMTCKTCKPPRKAARKPLINTTQVL